MGRYYFANYAKIGDQMAINKTHLTKLGYVENNEKIIKVYAFFDNGKKVEIFNPEKKFFVKTFKSEIENACNMKLENLTAEIQK